VTLGFLVLIQQTLLLTLVVIQCVPLRDSLLCQFLILQMYVLLDVQYVYIFIIFLKLTSLSIPLCLLFEQLELSLCLQLESLLLLCQLNLIVVLLLLNDLLEVLALSPPMKQFGLKVHPLFVSVVHDVPVLLQLIDLHLVLGDLLVPLLLDVLDLRLEARHDLVVRALVRFLQVGDLVLQLDSFLELAVVLRL